MLDANDYADPIGNLPPAERCLIPQWWSAAVPLEDAITAPIGPKSTAITIVGSSGRWVAACPDCGGAQLGAPEDPRFMCVDCGNVAVGGKWRPVIWPKDHAELGALLDARPRDVAHWQPGETVAAIAEENRMLAQARLLGAPPDDPAGNPFHPHWQGHTHSYPKKPDAADNFTCKDCGLVTQAAVLELDAKGRG